MRHEGHHVRVRCFVCWWYGCGFTTGRREVDWMDASVGFFGCGVVVQKRRGSAALRIDRARVAMERPRDGTASRFGLAGRCAAQIAGNARALTFGRLLWMSCAGCGGCGGWAEVEFDLGLGFDGVSFG